jgi:hypothetical protein
MTDGCPTGVPHTPPGEGLAPRGVPPPPPR